MQLSSAELKTLEVIFNKDHDTRLSRGHLEKLSRLDLIEPAGCGVAVSLRGKEILFNK